MVKKNAKVPESVSLDHDPIAFPKLNEAQIDILKKHASLKSFKKNQKLVEVGQYEFKFYVIKSGKVRVIDTSEQKIVAIFEAFEFTGEIDVFSGRPALVDIIAETDVEVYEVPLEEIKRIVAEIPQLSDILLSAFIARRELLEHSGIAQVRLVGSRYSKDTNRIREFLSKNRVLYTWIDLENESQIDNFLSHLKIDIKDTPVVLCTDGTVFRNPSNTSLATCLGIRKPLSTPFMI